MKYTIINDDISIADWLLLQFCRKSAELYGDDAITPNVHSIVTSQHACMNSVPSIASGCFPSSNTMAS